MFCTNTQYRHAELILALLFVLLAPVGPVLSATYYVDAKASNDLGSGDGNAPKKHIASGIALMSPAGGDTLIIANGFYAHPQDAIRRVVNGRPGAYNLIKAAEDGKVTIAQPITLRPFRLRPGQLSEDVAWQYVQFEGLKWIYLGEPSGANAVISGHHLKFLRSAFRGAGNCGNLSTVGIGVGDTEALNWRPTHHILLEDSWVYGRGGRYNISVFHADKIILRRVITRHDGGWTVGNGCKFDPEANIAVYNSADVELQNLVVLDSELEYASPSTYESAIYVVFNQGSGVINQVTKQELAHANERTRVRGSIVLNTRSTAIKMESVGNGVTDALITDSLLWNSTRAGLQVQSGTHTVAITRSLIGNNRQGAQRTVFGINQERDGNGSRVQAEANMIVNIRELAFEDDAPDGLSITEQNNLCIDSRKNNCAPGKGVLPNLRRQIGRNGSLFDDQGYRETTPTPLWPWPHQARIKRDLSETPEVGLRGWTRSGKSLGGYIADHLNHPAIDIEKIGLPTDPFN